MNKIKIPLILMLASSVLFSVFSVHFALDVSFFAFFVSAAITFFCVLFLYFKIFKQNDYKSYTPSLKLLQYLPYILLLSFILRRAGKNGTYYWYDVVTVLLWCVVIVNRWIILYYFNEKRIFSLVPEWKKQKEASASEKKRGMIKTVSGKKIVFEALDWIDALVQAVFMVLLIQIFIFQLYVIPSESMVPSFLVKDRVVVSKITSGPKFPLSDVGIPCLKNYKRGDVVVFRNPHYSLDRASEVRSVVSQIVYMLTFTLVNLNVDEHGEIKADPLVKRICGVPGEQLVMQDGVLYRRTEKSDIFEKVDFDAKYAKWNLNEIREKDKKSVQVIPLSQKQYEVMTELEAERRDFSIDNAKIAINADVFNSKKLIGTLGSSDGAGGNFSADEYSLFANYLENAKKIFSSSKAYEYFVRFLTDWENVHPDFLGDVYAEATYKLNLMIKVCVSHLYLKTAELLYQEKKDDEIMRDEKIVECLKTAEKLHFYCAIQDQRNMSVFPPSCEDGKPNYIPKDCFFMMGDNRFNSLDMRHSYEQKVTPLTKFDKYSVTYFSNLEPQFVNKKHILGSAIFRFWPLGRVGRI